MLIDKYTINSVWIILNSEITIILNPHNTYKVLYILRRYM
jgi:hypothetical protein